MTEYLTPGTGFHGALKSRYTDFCVNEVTRAGVVVHLTDASGTVHTAWNEATPWVENPPRAAMLPADALAAVATLLTPADNAVLISTLHRVPYTATLVTPADDAPAAAEVADPVDLPHTLLLQSPADKAARRTLYDAIRALSPSIDCEPTAVVGGGAAAAAPAPRTVSITFRAPTRKERAAAAAAAGGAEAPPAAAGGATGGSSGGGGGSGRGATGWPAGRPDFLTFVLCKTNWDTGAAVNAMAHRLAMRDRSFGYAGIKDRRAITCQLVSAYRLDAGRLVARLRGLTGVRVGNLAYSASQLRAGDLAGNEFNLVIRGVCTRDDTSPSAASRAATVAGVAASLQAWAAAGHAYINYFGLQRFGRSDAPTAAVGFAILRRDWRAAVRGILCPRAGERPEHRAAREAYAANGNAAALAAALPPAAHTEGALLRVLAKAGGEAAPGAALAAITAIPARMRSLYTHAAQAAWWNALASLRLRTYGCRAVVGDLVLERGGEAAAVEGGDDGDGDGDADGDGGDGDGRGGAGDGGPLAYGTLPAVRLVTEADVAGGLPFSAVVLPLPGYAVRYPAHDVGATVAYAAMAADGCVPPTLPPGTSAEDAIASVFHSRDVLYRFPGGYRPVLAAARSVTWQVVSYAGDATTQLSVTDADRGEADGGAAVAAAVASATRVLATSSDDGVASIDDAIDADAAAHPHLALRIAFTLPRSAYATVALREVMKQPGLA